MYDIVVGHAAGRAARPPEEGRDPEKFRCRARSREGHEGPPKKGRDPERLRCRACSREDREVPQERSREGRKAPQERRDPKTQL